MVFHEHISRSLVKALTYRLLIIISDGAIVYALTRRWDITAGVIGVSTVANTILYVFHERAWNSVHWGKEKRDNGPQTNAEPDKQPGGKSDHGAV